MSNYANMLGDLLSNKNVIPLNVITIDFCGGYEEAAIFTQLFYWMPRARITIDGKKWIAKSYKDWETEARSREKQSRRFIQMLVRLGFAETKIKRFNGNPTSHIHLNVAKMHTELAFYHEFWRGKQDVINEHGETTTRKVYENIENWRNVPAKTSETEQPKRTERPSQNGRNDQAKTDESLTDTTEYTLTEPTKHIACDDAKKNHVKIDNSNLPIIVSEQTQGFISAAAAQKSKAFHAYCIEHDLMKIMHWPDMWRDDNHFSRLRQFGQDEYLAELRTANDRIWKRPVKSCHRTLLAWFKRIDAGTSAQNAPAISEHDYMHAANMATVYKSAFLKTHGVPTSVSSKDANILLNLHKLVMETSPGSDPLKAWSDWVGMLMQLKPSRHDKNNFDWTVQKPKALLNNYGQITAMMARKHAPVQHAPMPRALTSKEIEAQIEAQVQADYASGKLK